MLCTTVLLRLFGFSLGRQLGFSLRSSVRLCTQKVVGETLLPRWEKPGFGAQESGS